MRNFRIVARLDVKVKSLIKGVQMEGWRKVGEPAEFAARYALEGADELMFFDVVASLYERNSLQETVRRVAAQTFIPMTVGGGVRSLEDVRELLACGADKVAINTAATRNPQLITQASNTFGSQAVVISIETNLINGQWLVMTDNGRNHTGLQAVDWAREAEARGAGEIVLTAIHKEGLGQGLDIELAKGVCDAVSIPVVVGGGLGKADHLSELLTKTSASAVSVAQALHWNKTTLAELRNTARKADCFVRDLPTASHDEGRL
ncbi:imidazole glycerol phosphate synthase cyclase subunit [uncultured Agrobacterium sp.]|uniref:imidazole glycerol phosphate synthase subunit HisF n=1 Tax=uncultured Agrobacterium sp. TaxID=157277 RepID=UPI0025ED2ABC|nr:imidazole glycerol phosphate synthase cyclase subunit [uncultured Agrobacterium sp.]